MLVLCLTQVHDRMTEQVYSAPLQSLESDIVPAVVESIPVMARGRAALEEVNEVDEDYLSKSIGLNDCIEYLDLLLTFIV